MVSGNPFGRFAFPGYENPGEDDLRQTRDSLFGLLPDRLSSCANPVVLRGLGRDLRDARVDACTAYAATMLGIDPDGCMGALGQLAIVAGITRLALFFEDASYRQYNAVFAREGKVRAVVRGGAVANAAEVVEYLATVDLDRHVETLAGYMRRLSSALVFGGHNEQPETYRRKRYEYSDILAAGVDVSAQADAAKLYPCAAGADLKATIDIDGIFGAAHLADAGDVLKNNLELDFGRRWGFDCVDSHFVFKDPAGAFADVCSCKAVFLGSSETSLGTLHIYLVAYPEFGTVTHLETVFSGLVEILKTSGCVSKLHTGANDTLTGTIKNRDLGVFFATVAGRYGPWCFLYFDSLGCKQLSLCAADEAEQLAAAVNDVVRADRCRSLRVDLAVSVQLGSAAVPVPAPSFYRYLGVQPSHFLLFSQEVANCNRLLREVKDGVFVHWPLQYDKVNCYSTLEDVIQKRRITKPVPFVAAALMRRAPFGVSVAGRGLRIETALSKVDDVVLAVRQQQSTCVEFRIEVRIAPFQLRSVLAKLLSFCTLQNFKYFDRDELAAVYTTAGNVFRSHIASLRSSPEEVNGFYSLDEIARSAAAETLYFKEYLSGNSNRHVLRSTGPMGFDRSRHYTVKGVAVPRVAEILTVYTSNLNVLKTCRRLVKSDRKLKQGKRDFYALLFDVVGARNALECFVRSFPRLESLGSAICRRRDGEVELRAWLRRYFIEDTAHKLYRCLWAAVMWREQLPLEEVITRLWMAIQERPSRLVPVPVNGKLRCERRPVRLDETDAAERAALLSTLVRDTAGAPPSSSNRANGPASDDEYVRLVHAWFVYHGRPKRFDLIAHDMAYGFWPKRDARWISNRYAYPQALYRNVERLRRVLAAAREWEPQPNAQFAAHGMLLMPETRSALQRLVAMDTATLLEHPRHREIKTAEAEDVLKRFIRDAADRTRALQCLAAPASDEHASETSAPPARAHVEDAGQAEAGQGGSRGAHHGACAADGARLASLESDVRLLKAQLALLASRVLKEKEAPAEDAGAFLATPLSGPAPASSLPAPATPARLTAGVRVVLPGPLPSENFIGNDAWSESSHAELGESPESRPGQSPQPPSSSGSDGLQQVAAEAAETSPRSVPPRVSDDTTQTLLSADAARAYNLLRRAYGPRSFTPGEARTKCYAASNRLRPSVWAGIMDELVSHGLCERAPTRRRDFVRYRIVNLAMNF